MLITSRKYPKMPKILKIILISNQNNFYNFKRIFDSSEELHFVLDEENIIYIDIKYFAFYIDKEI